jgi:hypothetical protein
VTRVTSSYRGTDRNYPDNVGLRRAIELQIPLVHFEGLERGLYFGTPWVPVGDGGPEVNSLTG